MEHIIPRETLKQLPKVELHRHLEGSVPLHTIKRVAQKLGIAVRPATESDPDEYEPYREKFCCHKKVTSLTECLRLFCSAQSLFATEEIIEEITYDVCEDCYKDGIRLLELRYSPIFIAQSVQNDHSHLTFESIHKSVLAGVKRAETAFPDFFVCLIGILDRTEGAKEQVSANFIIANKDTFAAIDLANDEGFSAEPFQPMFKAAKEANLGITVHAGEAGGAENVRYAIEKLFAQRIGHGIKIAQDQETISLVKQSGVILEISPTSNYITNCVDTLESHPIRELFDKGVKISINSDDPGIFDIDLTHEYEILNRMHNFTLEDFHKCNLNALEASFIAKDKKQIIFDKFFAKPTFLSST
eukprot:GEZU01037133.1.p1 GENE.GEZU01037133.1~~GEZU01037133.1.p1  ORF type:complete len:365 (-),score=114.45 GEZU01037133.1:86-1159(-)